MRWKHGTGSGCSLMAVLENDSRICWCQRDCRLVQRIVFPFKTNFRGQRLARREETSRRDKAERKSRAFILTFSSSSRLSSLRSILLSG